MTMAQRYLNYFKVLLMISAAVLITQIANTKGAVNIGGAIVGLLIISVICLLGMLIGEVKCLKKIPTFAWASLISLLLTTPFCPLADLIRHPSGGCKAPELEDRYHQHSGILRHVLWFRADRADDPENSGHYLISEAAL